MNMIKVKLLMENQEPLLVIRPMLTSADSASAKAPFGPSTKALRRLRLPSAKEPLDQGPSAKTQFSQGPLQP